MSIVRLNEFHAAPEQATALRQFLASVVEVIVTSPGCESCLLLVDHKDESSLVIVETWASIESHQAAATRIPPEQMAKVKPLLGEPPRGRYYNPAAR